MFVKTHRRSGGPALLPLLITFFILLILAASVVALWDPNCRERTRALTTDGLCVGTIMAAIRLVQIMQRRRATLFGWWCVARVLFGTEMKHGLVGGYLLGVSHAAITYLT